MTLRSVLLALVLFCVGLLVPGLATAQTFSKLTGRVVDAANLLDPAQEQALDARLATVEKDTGRQIVVATLPDLQGRDIADYGYRLGRAWGIGSKDKNDGALLIVAPNERRVRIEVGYGLEGVLTDAMSALIIANAITPRFKTGDYPGGIDAGVGEIAALLKLTPEEAKARAAAMEAAAAKDQQGGAIPLIVVLCVIGAFVVLPALFGRRRGGRRYRGMGGAPIILWGPGLGGGNDRWGSGGGWGGGGGGGGFSGGGGSFGGGGASGGW